MSFGSKLLAWIVVVLLVCAGPIGWIVLGTMFLWEWHKLGRAERPVGPAGSTPAAGAAPAASTRSPHRRP